MSLSSAMLVGFTGIRSNGVMVDTVGDNLANLNTTAFKGQRTLFETLIYRTIHEGEPPSATSGGTLPRQVGSGSGVAALQRDHRQGNLTSTGFPSDLAVDGAGFFILREADGTNLYTRDGAFRLDATQTVVGSDGRPVQVFAADGQGNIDASTLGDLVIPLGTASAAVETENVFLDGQLDSATTLASAGAVLASQALSSASGAAAGAATGLTDLVNEEGLPLFAAGDVLTVRVSKGGVAEAPSTFVVNDTGSTLGELAAYLEDVLGINTDPSVGGSPGVTVSDGSEAPAGALLVRSNLGEINAVQLDAGSIVNTTGAVTSPFQFVEQSAALGGGVTTSFGVFDSLGSLVDVRLRMAVESKSDTGITWRYFAESSGDTDLSLVLGTGTVTFDANGQFVAATGTDLSIDRAATGASTPLDFTLDFSALTGLSSPNGGSEVVMASQDGAPAGIMTGYSIDRDGVVTAAYSNQLTQVLGQVALAVFPNQEGLLALSENRFTEGPNSGAATILAPQTANAGAVVSGALEEGNVEIAREFINLIAASTGISSASRVVRVADQLLQELLLLAR